MKKLPFVLFAVFALFSGCDFLEDNNITEDKLESIFEYKFNDNVKFYGDELSVHVSLINDTTMLVGASMPSEHIPHVGDVILCPSTANTPRGFLRRAESIDNSTGGLIVNTIPATLADAFYTLKFEQTFDYADCAKEFRDSLGNKIPFEVLAGSVMEQLDSTKTNIQTKISGDADLRPKSLKFDISNRFFSGSAYLESQIYVKFDIGFGKVDVTYEIDKKVGLKGTAFISSAQLGGVDYEDDLTLSLLDKSIPVGTPIGPLWMQFFPSLNFGIAFIGNGNMSLEGKVNYVLEDSKSRYSYKNGVEHKEVINNLTSNSSWMKMVSLEAEGEFGLQGSVGMEFRLWNGDMLAFGGEGVLWYGLIAEAGISMSDQALLISNPKLTVGPKVSAALYIESYFINNRKHRIEAKVEKSFKSFYINILPDFKCTKETTGTTLTVKPTVEPISIIEVSQQGFALFSNSNPNTPITHKPLPSSTIIEEVPTAPYEDIQLEPEDVTFTLPSNTEEVYFIKPYVIADDNYYYGEGGLKRLKKVLADGYLEETYVYNEAGEITKIQYGGGGYFDLEYLENNQVKFVGGTSGTIHKGSLDKIIYWMGSVDESVNNLTYNKGNRLISSSYHTYKWNDHNICEYTDEEDPDGPHTTYVSYTDKPNLLNIDWVSSLVFPIPDLLIYMYDGGITENLPSSTTCSYVGGEGETKETITEQGKFTYKYDQDGYVIKMQYNYESLSSRPYKFTEIYDFEYEYY